MAVSAAAAPPNAAGFNVYVGTTPDSMALQNAAPITPGGSYTYIPGAVTGGKSPAWGQHPEFRRPLVRTFLRG
jgi:hypothetical protein